MKFKKTLIIDVAKNEHKKYTGKILDFTGMKNINDVAIVLTNTPDQPTTGPKIVGDQLDNVLRSLNEVKIIGPGRATKSTGVLIENGPFIGINNSAITEFGTGLSFGKNTWSNTSTNINIYRCGVDLDFLGKPNSGECIRFFGSNFFNSGKAVKMHNGHFVFYSCSFDYNWLESFDLNAGATAELYGSHLEVSHTRTLASPPIKLRHKDSRFRMDGGIIWVREANKYSPSEYFVDNKGLSYFNNIRASNIQTKRFSIGGGTTTLDNMTFINSSKSVMAGKRCKPWWRFWV